MIENVAAVSKADVAQIAGKIITSDSTSVAIIGGGDLDSITL